MGEEAGSLSQERVFGLYASELLEEGEGENLRVGELLEGGVAGSTRVDLVVGVVDSAEQDGECLFQEGQRGSMVGMGHLVILWSGLLRMAHFYLTNHAILI